MFTAVAWDDSDNQSSASTASHTVSTRPEAVTGAAGSSGNAGSVVITWTDSTANDVASVGITNTTSSTAERLIAVGTEIAVIGNLTHGTTYTFTLQVIDTDGLRSDSVTVTGAPPAGGGKAGMFSIGRHTGSFGFQACQNFLDDTSNAISAELQSQGFTEAIFFGSTPDYYFTNLFADPDALQIPGLTLSVSNARNISVFTEENGVVTERTTFGSPTAQTVPVTTIAGVQTTGLWPGSSSAPDVLEVLGARENIGTGGYWSFTNNDIYDAANNCGNAASADNAEIGVVGNTVSIDGSAVTDRDSVAARTCDTERLVFCVAH